DNMIENPDAYLNLVVKFTVRFNEFGNYYPIAYTHFDEERYINFSVWPLERKLWLKEDYSNDFKFLYFNKDNKEIAAILKLRKYDTITILGKVKSKFNKKPWIEVVNIQKERGFVTKKLISAIILAHKQIDDGDYNGAIETLRYVLDYDVPVDIRGYALKLLGRVYYEIDEIIPAAYEFKKALHILRHDLELQKWYKECYKIIVREGLKTEFELYDGTPRRVQEDYPIGEGKAPLDKAKKTPLAPIKNSSSTNSNNSKTTPSNNNNNNNTQPNSNKKVEKIEDEEW
ncbi:MAG: hypothetical protein AABZ60_13180, partial [Planctomycetota bacterium]